MLTITKPALQRLSRRLDRKGAADGMALRFTRREGGWKLLLDHETTGDRVFTHEGRKVLLLDKTVSEAMSSMTLETRASGQRTGFRLRRNEAPKD